MNQQSLRHLQIHASADLPSDRYTPVAENGQKLEFIVVDLFIVQLGPFADQQESGPGLLVLKHDTKGDGDVRRQGIRRARALGFQLVFAN